MITNVGKPDLSTESTASDSMKTVSSTSAIRSVASPIL